MFKGLNDSSTNERIQPLFLYILFLAGLLVISIFFGYSYSADNPGFAEKYLGGLREFFNMIKSMNIFAIMFIIFINNAGKSLIALVLGLGFGIVPIVFILMNGFIIGLIAEATQKTSGLGFVLAATIPHGIIEIPMVLLSSAVGLQLGHEMLLRMQGAKIDIKQELKKDIKFYIRFILPMLFIAAAIETFITPLVVSLVVIK